MHLPHADSPKPEEGQVHTLCLLHGRETSLKGKKKRRNFPIQFINEEGSHQLGTLHHYAHTKGTLSCLASGFSCPELSSQQLNNSLHLHTVPQQPPFNHLVISQVEKV